MQYQNADERLESSSAPEPKLFTLYFDFLLNKWGRLCIIVWWLIVLVIGMVYGRKLLDNTEFEFSAPQGTRGYKDDKMMAHEFKSIHDEAQLLIYYHCKSCQSDSVSILAESNHTLASMSSELNSSLFAYSAKHGNLITTYQDYFTALQYESTHSYIKVGFEPFMLNAYFNSDNTSMLGIMTYNKEAKTATVQNMLTWVNNEVTKVSKKYKSEGIEVKMTGQQPLVKDMSAESKADVEKKDVITIPVALSVLGLIVRSWRLMLIPIICVFASLMASFSIMNPIAVNVLSTSPFAPSIMMSVTVAMSIDYSLFLLTRFREETEKLRLRSPDALTREIAHVAIRQMTRWSGKVVALSGTILSLTYFALLAYPLSLLQSVGLGAGVAIVCTIFVNLTLTPALLLTFPNFFSTFGCTCRARSDAGGTPSSDAGNLLESDKMSVNSDGNDGNLHNSLNVQSSNANNVNSRGVARAHGAMSNPLHASPSDGMGPRSVQADLPDGPEAGVCDRCWYRLGYITTLFPWSLIIVVVVYGLISPIGWRVFELEKQLDDTLIFPRDSEYFKTYESVKSDFSAGALAPFYLLIPALEADGSNVNSESYFNHSSLIITSLYEDVTAQGYDVTMYGISCFNDETVNYTMWQRVKFTDLYHYLTANMISSNSSSSYFSVTTNFDPFNEDAFDFLDTLRGGMDRICGQYGYRCYLTGGSVDEVDTVNNIFDSFPVVLAVIISIIFCLMGIFFYSVFVPIRLFLTITVPMTLVYGLSILVYQKGMLSGLNVQAVADTGGLYWLIPVMTVTILVGLALDYDIFLFARIYEYRMVVGMPTRDAIIRGVYNTGSIITAAGCIMAIAFSGLLMSEMGSLNQTGFILVVAVLVDTFVIRTMLVPAVLSIAKEVNWWPGLKFGQHGRYGPNRISLEQDNLYGRPLDETM